MSLHLPPTAVRQSSRRFAACLARSLGAALLFLAQLPSAHSQSSQSEGGFALVSRCSNAARIVTGAAEAYPDYRADRDTLIQKAFADLKTSGKFGEQLPRETELFLTQVSMETLLGQGIRPRASAQAHDWMIAQTAATCVLKSVGK